MYLYNTSSRTLDYILAFTSYDHIVTNVIYMYMLT